MIPPTATCKAQAIDPFCGPSGPRPGPNKYCTRFWLALWLGWEVVHVEVVVLGTWRSLKLPRAGIRPLRPLDSVCAKSAQPARPAYQRSLKDDCVLDLAHVTITPRKWGIFRFSCCAPMCLFLWGFRVGELRASCFMARPCRWLRMAVLGCRQELGCILAGLGAWGDEGYKNKGHSWSKKRNVC